MHQPHRDMITQKILQVLSGELSREMVQEWAYNYIQNDDTVEITDMDAWHYLVDVSAIAEKIYPGYYLYSLEDIETWVRVE